MRVDLETGVVVLETGHVDLETGEVDVETDKCGIVSRRANADLKSKCILALYILVWGKLCICSV